jgi:two-component system, NarL family, nitrate/nitrite response regulator NarL
MSTTSHHFLASSAAQPPIQPSERWLLAFPNGQWSNWSTLKAQLKPGDTVWVPVAHADWEARVRELLAHQPACQVVVTSTVLQDPEGLRALNAGARGYCHALAVPAVLKEVAQVVAHGGLWLGPDLVQRLMAATRDALARSPNAPLPQVDLSVLSERERQVAQAVADGKSNKEVAEQLFISERTVKAHLGAAFEKLGVRDRVQLVLYLQGASRA